LEQILNENLCQTRLELASELGVTQQVICYRLQKLGKIWKKSRWILHNKLTPENKSRHHDIVLFLIFRVKKKDFLHKIVTCDEKCILYDKKRKSWVRLGEPRVPQNRTSMQKRCCYAFGGIKKAWSTM